MEFSLQDVDEMLQAYKADEANQIASSSTSTGGADIVSCWFNIIILCQHFILWTK